jgi:hypothetical protein
MEWISNSCRSCGFAPAPTNDASNSEKSSGKVSLHGKEGFLRSSPDHDGSLRNREEPFIRSGRDVSEFIVDVRDDGDVSLTFRSFILGTMFAGLAASLSQVCHAQLF